MATTFYLPSSSSAPDISPTPSTGWANTASMVRLRMSPTKANTAMTSKTITGLSSASVDYLFHQYIYGPLAPVTIPANVDWSLWVRGLESHGNLDGFPSTGIWIADSSGATRGTILAGGTQGPGPEYGLSLAGREHRPASLSSSSISVQGGDYLVLEVGISHIGGTNGLSATLNFGDNAASNLASTATTADNPVFIINTDFSIYNPDISVPISLGSLTLTGLAAVAIRESAGASLALGSETLTGISLAASAQALATLALGSVSLDGIAAIARVDADAAIDLGEVALTGIAFDALSSITALLNAATDLVIEGTDLTAQVTDESGDYSVLVNRATITNTGTALAITKGDAAIMAAAILNLAGVEAIVRKSEQAQVSEGAVTLTGTSLTATETEVGIMTRGVLTITGVEMLASAAVLAAMGHGTLTLTGTAAQGRLGFKFSQFSII